MEKRFLLTFVSVFVMACLLILGYLFGRETKSDQPLQSTNTDTTKIYEYSYMKEECREGLDNYTEVVEPKIGQALDQLDKDIKSGQYDVDYLEDRLKSIQKSNSEVSNRKSKLSTCIDLVYRRQDLAASDLAEFNLYIDQSLEIPVVN